MNETKTAWHLAALTLATMLSAAGPVAAQQPKDATPAANSPVDESDFGAVYARARARAKAGDWQGALQDYRRAFALANGKVDWTVAANHGRAALETGSYVEAARMLRYGRARLQPNDPDYDTYRSKFDERLAQAEAKVGQLRLQLEPAGAEVLIDGRSQGRAPLSETVYVQPGQRHVEARLAGYQTGAAVVVAVAGQEQTVTLVLVPDGPPQPPPEQETPSGDSPLVGVGIGGMVIGVAGLAVGIGLVAASSAKAGREQQLRDEILNSTTLNNPCGPGSAVLPKCDELAELADSRERMKVGGITALALGGALSAASVAVLIAGLSADDDTVLAAPLLAPGLVGATLRVRF